MDDWDDSPTVPENPGTKSSNSGNRNNDGRNNSWSGNRNNDGRNTSWSGNSYNDSAKNSWSGNSHNDGGGNWGGGRGSRGRGGRGRYDNQRPREPNDGSRVFTNSRSKFNQNQEEQTDSINIPQSLIGKFIGRGGSHINGLKDKYQVKLNIESGDSEPYLALSGPQELLKVAKKEISELIEEWIKQDESGDRRGSNRQDDGGSSYNNRENSWQNRGGNQRNEGGGHWEDRKENNQGSRGNNWEDNRTNNGGYNSQSQTTSESTTDTNSKEEVKIVDFAALNKQCDEMEAAYWAQFPPLVKTFYKELDEVKNWNMEEVEQFRLENFKIKVNRPMDPDCQTPIPKPVRTFYEAFHQYPEILETIKKVGFKNPTPIQCQAWPIIMSGEDVIGIAQTGTGKTLAFLLPAFLHIDGQTIPRNKRVGPTALVLAPTRELAVQIDKEVKKYEYKGIKSITIYGGASRSDQISKLKEGVELIIATPGRLDDLMMAGHVKVESFSYIVLDEADRMLDMGFEPQIRKIMYRVNPKRQTIMTSATWPSGVRRLCKSYTEHPVQICVGSLDLAAVDTVTQEIHFVEPDDKFDYDNQSVEYKEYLEEETEDPHPESEYKRMFKLHENPKEDVIITNEGCEIEDDECTKYTNALAEKLRAMDKNSRTIAMNNIDNIIYGAKSVPCQTNQPCLPTAAQYGYPVYTVMQNPLPGVVYTNQYPITPVVPAYQQSPIAYTHVINVPTGQTPRPEAYYHYPLNCNMYPSSENSISTYNSTNSLVQCPESDLNANVKD